MPKIDSGNIYLGDCYDLIKQIPDKSIDLIYTDIPYLMKNGGADIGKAIAKSRDDMVYLGIGCAKVYLMKTEKQNYFVLETSSNLNENPKMEQFILSNDQMLYDFYYNLFDNLIKNY